MTTIRAHTWKRTKAMSEEIGKIVDNISDAYLYEDITKSGASVGYNLARAINLKFVMAVSSDGYDLLKSTLDYLYREVPGLTLSEKDL